MEATSTREPGPVRLRGRILLREPVLWASLAAFVGTALGLVGTIGYASFMASFSPTLSQMLFSTAAQFFGETIVALSLLGVPTLLGDGFRRSGLRAATAGGFLLSLFFITTATAFFYLWYANTGGRVGTLDPFPRIAEICFWISVFTPPAVVVPFAYVALWTRRLLLGALLSGLCVLCFPLALVWFYLHPEGTTFEPMAALWLFGLLGAGVGIPEAILWMVLGVVLWRGARENAYRRAWSREAEKNCKKALRLYEQGLGNFDLSVVDELVSEDFHDLRSGSSGRLGMERTISDLWASYPDLSVSVEAQETERDVVRTRLLLSGTDHGGVMWYPPMHRPVAFSAEFADRFVGGELVEHAGEADTEGLLRQLGHRRGDGPVPRPTFGDGSRP